MAIAVTGIIPGHVGCTGPAHAFSTQKSGSQEGPQALEGEALVAVERALKAAVVKSKVREGIEQCPMCILYLHTDGARLRPTVGVVCTAVYLSPSSSCMVGHRRRMMHVTGLRNVFVMRRRLAMVSRISQAPVVLRLMFHDAATYDARADDGGANASLRFELDRPENFGLKRGWRVIEAAMEGAAGMGSAFGGQCRVLLFYFFCNQSKQSPMQEA